MWVAVITVIVVACEGSVLIRYITQFTEEIFATLISLIFLYEVMKKLYYVSIDQLVSRTHNFIMRVLVSVRTYMRPLTFHKQRLLQKYVANSNQISYEASRQ